MTFFPIDDVIRYAVKLIGIITPIHVVGWVDSPIKMDPL